MKTYVDFLRFVTSESRDDSLQPASLQNGGVSGSISWGGGEAKAVLRVGRFMGVRVLTDLFVTSLVINRFSMSVFLDIQLKGANRPFGGFSTQCWVVGELRPVTKRSRHGCNGPGPYCTLSYLSPQHRIHTSSMTSEPYVNLTRCLGQLTDKFLN
jgi:hypothetical protein